ncbi:MAG: ThiF family adenylyltransferase [Daejeonella sp.]
MAYRSGNPRYQRQISLREFGESGQKKLYDAKVLVVGAGGLGCPALQYLVAAGIGTIGIADHDTVSISNLHRQVLYSTDDTGLSKALRAADILGLLNPEIEITAYNYLLTSTNALGLISQFDIILDGTDNFASRYMINDACVILKKTLVYGAISRFEGQVAIFNCQERDTQTAANYRDLFPQPPAEGEIQNCEEAGVLGVLPGIIGSMMANETIKLIAGTGDPLINRLITYNSLNNQLYELGIEAGSGTRSLIPADADEFKQTDYEWLCSGVPVPQIDHATFTKMLNQSDISVIDVREINETPIIKEFEHVNIPMSLFRERLSEIKADTVILFCQSGNRSANAARILSEYYGNSKKIYSLKEGIINWKNLKKI